MDGSKRDAILASLQKIVGPGHVLTDPALFAGALSEPRGLYHGKTLALVRPAAAKEVAAIAALCNEARIGIVPQGGNTGLGRRTDAGPERRGDHPLDPAPARDPGGRPRRRRHDLRSGRHPRRGPGRRARRRPALSPVAGVGGKLHHRRQCLDQRRRRDRVAYGNTRDLVTGVEAVLADGRIVNGLSKLRKDNTGYDVKGLFIGAEGTLGVVTAASLRLFPNPRVAGDGLRWPQEPRGRAEAAQDGARAPRPYHQLRADRTQRPRHNGQERPGAKAARQRPSLVRADGGDVANAGADSTRRSRKRCRRRSRAGSSTTRRSPLRSSSGPSSGACANRFRRRRSRRAPRSSTTSRSRSPSCRL